MMLKHKLAALHPGLALFCAVLMSICACSERSEAPASTFGGEPPPPPMAAPAQYEGDDSALVYEQKPLPSGSVATKGAKEGSPTPPAEPALAAAGSPVIAQEIAAMPTEGKLDANQRAEGQLGWHGGLNEEEAEPEKPAQERARERRKDNLDKITDSRTTRKGESGRYDNGQDEPALDSDDRAEDIPFEVSVNGAGFGRDGARGGTGQERKPAATLPRTFYFENTYMGGDAGYLHALRRLNLALEGDGSPHLRAYAPPPPLDPPEFGALALSASTSLRWLDAPSRVVLQVALRGSDRHGWRRPPLDLALVLDTAGLPTGSELPFEIANALSHQLGPQDRLAIFRVGQTTPLSPLSSPRELRSRAEHAFAGAQERAQPHTSEPWELQGTLNLAAQALQATTDPSAIPGTRVVLLFTASADPARSKAAATTAHALTTEGVFTSVAQYGLEEGEWWNTAAAGYGNYHSVKAGGAAQMVAAELEALSRVVARLVRINIRLAPHVQAVRILGSRALDAHEVAEVKAREVATDAQLSRALGVTADRGDDDDGIQTVIPYLLGGDSHSVLVELWVDSPKAGPIADVVVRYKDMVRLGSYSLAAAAGLSARPVPLGPQERQVQQAALSAQAAERFGAAASRAAARDDAGAIALLQQSQALLPEDRAAAAALANLLANSHHQGPHRRDLAIEAIELAAKRKLGHAD